MIYDWCAPKRLLKLPGLGLAAMLVLAACGGGDIPDPEVDDAPEVFSALPDMNIPPDNPVTPEKAELGRQLFFDTRLSDSGTFSCETCHLPEFMSDLAKPGIDRVRPEPFRA